MKKQLTGVETIIEKVGTDGIVADTHPATTQLVATTDYRYTGANPNNYVKFNNEVWRIIGVFDTDDGTGNLEKRMKIIRNDGIGELSWGDTTDWTTSSLKVLLNSGDYYNRTGSYTSNGLTDDAKLMIDDVKWYLGGAERADSYDSILVSDFYNRERGNVVFSNSLISLVAKVGLMYPSDYSYATSGGATTNRDACLVGSPFIWRDASMSDCKNNDWLYNKDYQQWTITHVSNTYSKYEEVYSVLTNSILSGNFDFNGAAWYANLVRPTVYLKADTIITDGSGSASNPYKISLK